MASDKNKDAFEKVLRALREAIREGHLEGQAIGPKTKETFDQWKAKRKRVSDAEMIRHLKAGYALFNMAPEFQPGDIIRGKRELTAYLIKHWDRPHIVLEILTEPVVPLFDAESITDAAMCKRYDMVIGIATHTDDPSYLMRFYCDSRDWELFPNADEIGKADQ